LKRDFQIPDEVNEQLWNWGSHFRDRHSWGRCASAEKNYKPHSSDYAKEGWGEPVPPPKVAPTRSNAVLEAIKTNDLIMQLPRLQKWALTLFFCYPSLPRFVTLKILKKYAGERVTWTRYLEVVEIGRLRVYTLSR
jgi:hypothetical protein